MCTGLEPMLLGAAGAAAASSLLAPKTPSVEIPQPTKPPQASKAPDRAATVATNKAAAGPGGAMSGNSGTFLTGASGIDPSSLNLGKNTLLGQ